MRSAFLSLLVGSLLGLAPVLAADPVRAAGAPDVVSQAVRYDVRNINRTAVPCGADRATYSLSGRLVGPADGSPERVNVLVHDITAGNWFWHLREHPAYDYASQLALRGETSLVLDRLGYDRSPLADGRRTCLGAQADMLHQVVTQLRRQGVEQVVLHGHSVGAAIAELEAATFRDVDGLVLMSWSDSGATPRAVGEALLQHQSCLLGGRDYAPYGRTDRDFRELLFVTAADEVVRTATRLRNEDPCGDALSLAQLVIANNALTRLIDVPVLLVFAGKDALNRPDARILQPLAYGLGARVTTRTVPGAGSALPLETSAPVTREHVLRWLGGL
jgi:pimeloyl-ACP methyl ester carboxylesterase